MTTNYIQNPRLLMATGSLEERVVRLEGLVEKLRAGRTSGRRRRDWRRTIGISTGDALMLEIDKEALKYREADRRKARRQLRRARPPKP
jgi:hypothetical protein